MGQLIFLIVVVVVITVLRRLAEYNRNRPRSDDEWSEWTAEGTSPPPPARPPVPRPTPSERVRQILEQLAQQEEPTRPPLVPPPPPVPQTPAPPATPTAPPPLPAVRPPPVPTARPAYAAPAPRRYLSEDALAAAAAPETTTLEVAAPLTVRAPAADAVYRESLRKAFPPAAAMVRETRAQGRRPFVIRMRGRQSLRQAIALAEVLGPPRAYDL